MGRTRLPPPPSPVLLAAGIVLIAINLRASITVVGPIVADVRGDLGLSSAAAGLLTTLPVLAFGVASPIAVPVARRIGIERTLTGAMALLLAGVLLRVVGSVWAAYAGTGMLGVAIAAGNVLLPGLVKRDFPERTGPMTSLYVTVMVAMAGISSSIAVPLAEDLGLGWRGALGVWAAPAAVTLAAWLPRGLAPPHPDDIAGAAAPPAKLRRSALAWWVTAYMGLQSFVFYVLIAWLPALLRDAGVSATGAGLMVGVMQATSLAATIAVPVLAGRRSDQRSVAALVSAMGSAAMVGLLVAPGDLALVWAALVGVAGGATLSLSLGFFVWRTAGDGDAAGLSGMAQSIGYLFAATGPFVVGALHDATGGWTVPLFIMLAFWAGTGVVGLWAGRDRVVA